MFSNKLYTPLRYPGGKSKFAPFIADVMIKNGLEGGHYLEPYAGGAGVALELLFHNHASHVHINDADPAIADFWDAVTKQPDDLLRLLNDTPITIEQWHYWRSILRGEIEVPQLERGFAALFLNRTNRSGILKGGVIGGLKQDGPYRLDVRMKKDVLAGRIKKIAEHSHKISVYNEDALQLLKRVHTILPTKSLIYLDPPYYVKGRGLYRNFYGHGDHEAIAKYLMRKSFNRRWVVSYDNVPEIRDMYCEAQFLSYDLHYTAQTRYNGAEIMFFPNKLTIPNRELQEAA